jgi:paraquat-inducible protein A
VKFQALGDIEPRPGILFFGLVVVFTMFSAMSFDPRLIWDNAPDDEPLSDVPPQATPATDGAAPDPTGA